MTWLSTALLLFHRLSNDSMASLCSEVSEGEAIRTCNTVALKDIVNSNSKVVDTSRAVSYPISLWLTSIATVLVLPTWLRRLAGNLSQRISRCAQHLSPRGLMVPAISERGTRGAQRRSGRPGHPERSPCPWVLVPAAFTRMGTLSAPTVATTTSVSSEVAPYSEIATVSTKFSFAWWWAGSARCGDGPSQRAFSVIGPALPIQAP